MNRPYSCSELEDVKRELVTKHRLSNQIVVHTPCLHRYYVKKGGRKEQYVTDSGPVLDDQTCSVCFKARTTGNLPNLASDFPEDEPLTRKYLADVDLFYKWLYRHDYA